MSDKHVYTLIEPVEILGGKRRITELHLEKRIRGKHIKGTKFCINEQPGWDDTMKVLARLAGEVDEVVSELCLGDLQALYLLIIDFLGIGQSTDSTTLPSSPENSAGLPETS